jgi:N-methylhydantoinase A
MQGNGGTLSAQIITDEAIKTVMSGPASGVIAAAFCARSVGIGNVLTYDMGGTSSDVALIRQGVPAVSSELELEYALPIHVPMVDVHSIGAGGGSIAFINDAGMLQVGPHSAGAHPGPICYGRGGQRPTITDANLVLGRLPADKLLAVDHPVSVDYVAECIAASVGRPLGLAADQAAAAIIRIANDKMAGAMRMVSLARGEDPRDFALFAFGGAGPLHATALARELSIPQVLIPPRPGITNAIGCVVADARHDFVQTVNKPLSEVGMDEIYTILADQVGAGEALLAREKTPIGEIRLLHSADMQFRGQTHVLQVALDGIGISRSGAQSSSDRLSRDQLQQLFEQAYFDRFAVKLPEIGTMLINLNTTVIGQRQPIQPQWLIDTDKCAATLKGAEIQIRPVWFDGDWHDTPVYQRVRLPLNARFIGPAIIQQLDTTVVIEPGNRVNVDRQGNLLIDVTTA